MISPEGIWLWWIIQLEFDRWQRFCWFSKSLWFASYLYMQEEDYVVKYWDKDAFKSSIHWVSHSVVSLKPHIVDVYNIYFRSNEVKNKQPIKLMLWLISFSKKYGPMMLPFKTSQQLLQFPLQIHVSPYCRVAITNYIRTYTVLVVTIPVRSFYWKFLRWDLNKKGIIFNYSSWIFSCYWRFDACFKL